MTFPIDKKQTLDGEILNISELRAKGIKSIKETIDQEKTALIQKSIGEFKLRILPTDERGIGDKQVLEALDEKRPEFSNIKKAVEDGDIDKAKQDLISYFRTRKNVKGFYDYRDEKKTDVDFLSKPYMWQHYNSDRPVKDYILEAGKKLLNNTYLLPHGKELFLGENLEKYPVASYEETVKIQQGFHLIFQRGYFLEILALYYQITKDKDALLKFQEMLSKFFEVFHLVIEEQDPDSTWFQYSQNRETMNVGWLIFTFINLLNTSIVYQCDTELIFGMIKRIWFFGIQYGRYKNVSFQPHNIYFFTRGIVPYVISKLIPEFTDFKELEKDGKKKILEYIKYDFSDAGGYAEHSIGYWLGATVGEMLSKVLITAKNEQDHFFDNESCKRLDRMFNMVALITPPSEYYDVIGDQGGVRVETYLQMGEELFDNQACRDVMEARNGKEIKLKHYCCNPGAGFIAARDSYQRDANYIILSCREDAKGSGHDHMDMLSLDLTIRGEQIFSETYAGALYKNFVLGKAPRGFLYNMTSHNNVLVHSEPIIEDSFFESGWAVFKPKTIVSNIKEYKNHLYFKASHTGYCFCKVNREVQFMDGIGVAVKDSVSEGIKNEKPHIQRWFLAYGVTYRKLEQDVYLFEKNGAKALCIWRGRNLRFHIYKPEFLVPTIGGADMLQDVFDVEFSIQKRLRPEDREPHAGVLMLDVSEMSEEQIWKYLNNVKELDVGDISLYQKIKSIL